MTPEQYVAWFSEEVSQAVADAQEEAARETLRLMREAIPASRIETRRALRARRQETTDGQRTVISLAFRQRFQRVTGTTTEEIYEEAWRRASPRILDVYHEQLAANLAAIHDN